MKYKLNPLYSFVFICGILKLYYFCYQRYLRRPNFISPICPHLAVASMSKRKEIKKELTAI